MITVNEIQQLKTYLVTDYHSNRITNQRKWQEFYEDKFKVPQIKPPLYVQRTGTAAWLINGPSAHIITKNPQFFVEPRKTTEKARESATKVNALGNHWIRRLLKQTPQPCAEFAKNLFLRGEAWYHPMVQEDWEKDSDFTLPINFSVPDPLIVYSSGKETYGIPDELIMDFKKNPYTVQKVWQGKNEEVKKALSEKFLEWIKGTIENKPVNWFEYWHRDYRYFECDGIPIFKDEIQKNIHGMPFIHAYSGFGKDSPDGDPASLAMGRLAPVLDLLIQECAIISDIDSTLHKFAHPRVLIVLPLGTNADTKEIKKAIDMGAGTVSVVEIPLPESRFDQSTTITPPQEAFQHYYNIRQRITTEAPPIMAGLPSGTSGRQEDIIATNFIRRFDSVAEAIESATAKMLDMGLKALNIVPGWLPINQWLEHPEGNKDVTITKEDLDAVTESRVVLKAADPIEDDRKLMAGRALVGAGRIDWEEFLVNYVGYTSEKANEIIINSLADKALYAEGSLMLRIMELKALEKLGMGDLAQQLLQQGQGQPQVGSQGGPPRSFNQQGAASGEKIDAMLRQGGIRGAPELTEF